MTVTFIPAVTSTPGGRLEHLLPQNITRKNTQTPFEKEEKGLMEKTPTRLRISVVLLLTLKFLFFSFLWHSSVTLSFIKVPFIHFVVL